MVLAAIMNDLQLEMQVLNYVYFCSLFYVLKTQHRLWQYGRLHLRSNCAHMLACVLVHVRAMGSQVLYHTFFCNRKSKSLKAIGIHEIGNKLTWVVFLTNVYFDWNCVGHC
jgi:hypothetical protein